MGEPMMTPLTDPLIGIDGGGSGCRFALVRGGQRVEVSGGPANVSTDFEGAMATLDGGIHALADRAGRSVADLATARIYVALAGVVSADLATEVARRLPFPHIVVADDRIAATTGALGAADGCVIGIGTGSFLARKVAGQTRLIGGWGLNLGDDASGAHLGRGLLQRAVLGVDGLGPTSELTQAVLQELGGPAGVVGFAATATPRDFAKLAPRIVAAATAGDRVARGLLSDGAAYIERGLRRLGWQPGDAICPVGGLAACYGDGLPDEMADALTPPKGSGLDGALALAATIAPGWQQP